MRFEQLLQHLFGAISGVRAKAYVAKIAEYHRIQASPGYDEALQFVESELVQLGIETSVSAFPADGKTKTYGWTAPIGWRIRSGTLRQIEPERRILCSFDDVATSILGQSGAGNTKAELVHIGEGTSAADVEGCDLAGRFVLAGGRATEVLKRIRGMGAAGLIIYPDTKRAAADYDLVQYAGLFPNAEDLDSTPMGFSISRREADRLIAQLEKGRIRLSGEVDADYFDGEMRTLEATIPGEDPKAGEILLVAHLCHPRHSANDNASGSGLLLEVARVLKELAAEAPAPLRHRVRLLWVPEFNGAIPWAAANVETLRAVRFALNLDMVGQSPEAIGEPFRVFRVPNARSSILNACFGPILARIAESDSSLSAQGSRRALHYVVDRPSGGSDHLVFQATPFEIPAPMFGHDDPFWHTDLDTIDKTDPTRLKQVGILTAALATLPTWAPEETGLLIDWLTSFGAAELSRASALSRSMEPEQRSRLLRIALDIEEARAGSLAELCSDCETGPLGGALRAVHAAFGGPAEREAAPLTSSSAPRRVQDGPVRYTIVDEFDEDERAIFDELLSNHHRAAVASLVDLCDGERSIEEIALRLTLDFDRPFSAADAERCVKLLVKAGYLAV